MIYKCFGTLFINMVEWQITNIVFTIKFNTFLPIDKLAKKMDNDGLLVDYDPDSFPALIVTLENNKENIKKITVFRSGVMNIYGLKKIEEICDIIKKIKKLFSKYGIDLPDNYEIKLNNVIIAGKFDYKNIDIEKIFHDFDDTYYDPTRFPAVVIPYHLSNGYKIKFNVFRDGSFVCAGIKGDLNNIYQYIKEIVNSFQENVIKKYAKQ